MWGDDCSSFGTRMLRKATFRTGATRQASPFPERTLQREEWGHGANNSFSQ